MTPDREAIRSHVQMIHERVGKLARLGKLVVASYGEDPATGSEITAKVEHFDIGDVEGMTTAILRLAAEPYRNVYTPLAVFKKGLPSTAKGKEVDILAVFGIVADFDDAGAAHWASRIPLPASYALQTSSERFQTFSLLAKPAPLRTVKPVAVRLKQFCRCDHGTADVSHVWRIPGTLNWPNKKKVEAGRPSEPQLVQVAQSLNGSVKLAELSAALPNEGAPAAVKALPAPPNNFVRLEELPPWFRDALTEGKMDGVPITHTGQEFGRMVAYLRAAGKSELQAAVLFGMYPNGIAKKFAKGRRLDQEVHRVWEKKDAAEIIDYAEVLAEAKALTRESTPGEVGEIVRKLAAARFGPIEEGTIRDAIMDSTRQKAKAVDAEIKRAKAAVRSAMPASRQWMEQVIVSRETGEPKPILLNNALAFREDPEWRGVLALNEFTGWITLRASPPWEDPGSFTERSWTDADVRQATLWLQEVGIHARSKDVFEAVACVAEENKYHPVRDFLDGLVWDGTERLDDWLIRYVGVHDEDEPDQEGVSLDRWREIRRYVKTVGARYLISAVARIYEPGCKADCVPILIGNQGIMKSTMAAVLFHPWFTDELAELGSKDAGLQVQGVWGIELSELDAMTRSEISGTKAFISRQTDRFRPPYGMQVSEHPRQCVFIGSSNEDEIFRDTTGNRRYWPVAPGKIDIAPLRADRNQLWAEVAHRYRNGEKWWIDEPDLVAIAEKVQAAYQEGDAWDGRVAEYLNGLDEPLNGVTTADVLEHALFITDPKDWDKRRQMQAAGCLRRLGWSTGGKQQWKRGPDRGVRRYFPPEGWQTSPRPTPKNANHGLVELDRPCGLATT